MTVGRSPWLRLWCVEFLCYHRDRPGSATLRYSLLEEHWTYMDSFESELIARGPTFTDDDVLTGSVHIVDVPDPAAARAFAFEEPGYQAGTYRDVLLRRFRNLLDRDMWQFPDRHGEANRYLVLGLGSGANDEPTQLDVRWAPLIPTRRGSGHRSAHVHGARRWRTRPHTAARPGLQPLHCLLSHTRRDDWCATRSAKREVGFGVGATVVPASRPPPASTTSSSRLEVMNR